MFFDDHLRGLRGFGFFFQNGTVFFLFSGCVIWFHSSGLGFVKFNWGFLFFCSVVFLLFISATMTKARVKSALYFFKLNNFI